MTNMTHRIRPAGDTAAGVTHTVLTADYIREETDSVVYRVEERGLHDGMTDADLLEFARWLSWTEEHQPTDLHIYAAIPSGWID